MIIVENEKYYLVGDVGGTKTELVIYSGERDIRKYKCKERIATTDYESLQELIARFLSSNNLYIEKCVLAVAGPVLNDDVTLTSSNLPWRISRADLIRDLNIPDILLINDLEALARAIPHLTQSDLYAIIPGIRKKKETLAVIAPGTGLGESFLIWDGEKYKACASEGANVNFGPRTDFEIALLRHMRKKHQHVTYELVCSGLGIPLIYECLKENFGMEDPLWVSELLRSVKDKTPVIINAALQTERSCPLATETLKHFVSILGAETGNLVLKTMAKGGVFLGGGIPPRIIPLLDSEVFLESYRDKGLMTEMMYEIPVHIITTSDGVIMGAADYLFSQYTQVKS